MLPSLTSTVPVGLAGASTVTDRYLVVSLSHLRYLTFHVRKFFIFLDILAVIRIVLSNRRKPNYIYQFKLVNQPVSKDRA
jgi:hypothetical protein